MTHGANGLFSHTFAEADAARSSVVRFWPELAAGTVAFSLYASTLRFGLVFDDHSLIDEHGPRFLGREWLPYRPLRFASLWLDFHLGGGAVWAYHLTNVALHALAAALVVRLCRRAGAGELLAFAAALAFACHPIAVEAVAYVAGRRDLLAAVWSLGAVVAWTSSGGASVWAIVCLLLAVAAKEVGVLLVPLLLLASACGLGPAPRKAAGVLAAAGVAAVLLPVAYGAEGPLLPAGAVTTKLIIAGRFVAHYVRNLLAPGALSVEYPALRCASAACANLAGGGALAGIALLMAGVVAAGVAVRRARSRPDLAWPAFALGWVVTWVAALAFAVGGHEPGSDRHAYLFLAGAAVAIAAFAARAGRALRDGTPAILLVVAGALAVVTNERIATWQSDLTLWRASLSTASSSARVHHNLAAALAEHERWGAARRHLARASAIDPGYWPALLGFAGVDCARGRFAAAEVRIGEARALGATEDEVERARLHCASANRAR